MITLLFFIWSIVIGVVSFVVSQLENRLLFFALALPFMLACALGMLAESTKPLSMLLLLVSTLAYIASFCMCRFTLSENEIESLRQIMSEVEK
jgi:hypothetical protein